MTPGKSIVTMLLALGAGAIVVGAAGAGTLTVGKSGSGFGTVTSNIGGIACGAACSDAFNDGTNLTLTASADVGSQFTGWLGPCTGAGSCQFTLNGATTAVATFAAPVIGTPALDVDDNTGCDALTDGLMALRYLFGLTGPALVAGALGPLPGRSSESAIGGFLADMRPALDVDGNGQADALTDGLLAIRYLFSLRGDGLIANAVGSGAIRDTAPDIEAKIATLCAPPPVFPLTVTKPGTGAGTVTSAPPGVSCGGDCAENYIAGTGVALTATPAAGSAFSGWGIACAGTSACKVTMAGATSVSAGFTLLDTNPACASNSFFGSISGDTGSGGLATSGVGEKWIRVRLTEDNQVPFTQVYLSAMVVLNSPVGTDYDLYVYCLACGGTLAGSSTSGGQPDVVNVRRNDTLGSDESYDILIEVRYFSGNSGGTWNLSIQGNTAVGAATCP